MYVIRTPGLWEHLSLKRGSVVSEIHRLIDAMQMGDEPIYFAWGAWTTNG